MLSSKIILMAVCLVVTLAVFPTSSRAQATQTDALMELAGQPWKGDLDGMIDRGFIRILTTYDPVNFSYSGDAEAGLAADINREFLKRMIGWYGKKGKQLTILTIPVPRNELISRLLDGRGDIIAANLTITPERQKSVQFSDPVYTRVTEVVVTSKAVGPVKSLDDLVLHGLTLRASSSYFEHMEAINAQRVKDGKESIKINMIEDVLEDYDVLELINAGVVPATVIDSHKVQLWAQVFDDIVVNDDVFVNDGGEIAWAMRPDTPELHDAVNRFVKEFRKGTLLGIF